MRYSFLGTVILFCVQLPATNFFTSPTAQEKQKQNISFTENRGQVYDQHVQPRPDVLFTGEVNGMDYHLRNNGISYQLMKVDSWKQERVKGQATKVPDKCSLYRVDLNWPGCNETAEMHTDRLQAGYTNYFRSVCPSGVYNVRSFDGVTYQSLYNGIDLHYFQKDNALKYDYIVAPGADYKQIKIEIKGATAMYIGKAGEIIIETPLGKISEHAPIVIQDGKKLQANWALHANILSFDIKGINSAKSFIIDPAVRIWGTYYGNSSDEKSWSCVTDAAGNVYMSGEAATGGLATVGSHQQSLNGSRDAILVKFNSAGIRKWATYYGSVQSPGGPATRSYGCNVDDNGNVYMVGTAPASTNGAIATAGSHQPALGGSLFDAYLVKFDSTGQRQWGTYYGGDAHDSGESCVTDVFGNVYLVGYTSSTVGIATATAFQTNLFGSVNAFIAKFNSAGQRIWGTYYGIESSAEACDIDGAGNIVIAGNVGPSITNNMGSVGSHQPAPGGSSDAFVAKFDPSGQRLWGTYYGGAGYDQSFSCALDCNGNVFLSGFTELASTTNSNVMATTNAFQTSYAGGYADGFLAKFNSAGQRQWATLFGSNLHDNQYGCATDVEGNAYIAGYSFANFPLSGSGLATPGAHQTFIPGETACYLAKFSTTGQRLWGTYYGFDGTSESGGAFACATHSSGSVYLTGQAPNPFMPGTFTLVATPGAFQTSQGSPWNQSGYYYDMFLVRFSEPVITPTTVVSIASSTALICSGSSATLTASGSSNYVWSPSGTGSTIVVSPSVNTTYALSGDDACYPALFTLSVAPLPNVTATTGLSVICKGVTSTLVASGALNYTWQPLSISATSIVVTPSVTSTYTAVGTGTNGCISSNTVTQVVNKCAGLNDLSNALVLSVYPNPAANTLYITANTALSFSITNQLGQVVLHSVQETEVNQIDISALNAGVYFLSVSRGGTVVHVKFLKGE